MRTRRRWSAPGSALMALFSLVTVVFVSTPLVLFGPTAVEPSPSIGPSAAAQLAWIQWTAPASYPNSASFDSMPYTYATQALGTIAIPGGSTVYVKFTGEILNSYGASGFGVASNSYWKNRDGGGVDGAAFRSTNVPDLPTNGDRIGVCGSYTGGVQLQKLEFFSDSARTVPVDMTNLVMDIWSLGDPEVAGTWNFTRNFDVLSDNTPPVSTYSGFTKGVGGPPYPLSGNEGSGTIQFTGSYSALSWTVMAPELYATWNIGVTTATAPSDPGITPSRSTITGDVGTAIAPVTFTDKEFVGAVTYAVKSGTLPAGLALNPATGEITGTPTGPASATVVIEATGATSGVATATLEFAFTDPSYTVTFDSAGGSPVPNGSYVSGGGVTFPTAPTRDGFTFLGWFAAASGGTALTDGYVPSGTGPITLYAQWAAVPVTTTTSTTSTTSTTIAAAPAGPSRSSLPFTGAQIATFALVGSLMLVAGVVLHALGQAGSTVGGGVFTSGARTMAAAAATVRERTRRPRSRRRPSAAVGAPARRSAPAQVRPAPAPAPTVVLKPRPVSALVPPLEVVAEPVVVEPAVVPEPIVAPEPTLAPPVEVVVEPTLGTPPSPAWARARAVASAQLAEDWALADRVAAAAHAASLRARRRLLEGATGESALSWRARLEAQLRELDIPLD